MSSIKELLHGQGICIEIIPFSHSFLINDIVTERVTMHTKNVESELGNDLR